MMRRLVVLGLAAWLATGCSSSDEASLASGEMYDGAAGEGSSNGVQAGQMTAGTWDDNRNYDFFLEYLAEHGDLPGAPPFTMDERGAAHEASLAAPGSHDLLDVALVVDTTGSMGDEIGYLQAEFQALSSEVNNLYPQAEQRWALVVYRDQGDAYVVDATDFTSDLNAFQATLAKQRAAGGGDYPEAPDAALASAVQLDWRQQVSAKLMFWIADAPHHSKNAASLVSAVRAACEGDIHIYPIAASDTDELTELSMRSAAQLTLGRYLFLTDDSGIGNEHKEPTIPCYFVTRLDQAILRMIDIEMSGHYLPPDPDQVIRTGGDPVDGVCELEGGEVLQAF